MRRWTFTGQPMSEFPAWLIAQNFARDADGQFLVIHQLWQKLIVNHGDTLILGKNPYLDIERKKDIALTKISTYVEPVDATPRPEQREQVMSL